MASDPQKKERLSTLWCTALATSKPGPLQVNKQTLNALVYLYLIHPQLVLMYKQLWDQHRCWSVTARLVTRPVQIVWAEQQDSRHLLGEIVTKTKTGKTKANILYLYLCVNLTAGVFLLSDFLMQNFPTQEQMFALKTSLCVKCLLLQDLPRNSRCSSYPALFDAPISSLSGSGVM